MSVVRALSLGIVALQRAILEWAALLKTLIETTTFDAQPQRLPLAARDIIVENALAKVCGSNQTLHGKHL
jgi:hypothetical protein